MKKIKVFVICKLTVIIVNEGESLDFTRIDDKLIFQDIRIWRNMVGSQKILR